MFNSKNAEKPIEEGEKMQDGYIVVCQRREEGLDVLISNLATKEELNAIIECIGRHYLDNNGLSGEVTH